jgi:maltokinase
VNVKEISESALLEQRWYAGKARLVRAVSVAEAVPVPGDDARLVIAEVSYGDGGLSERYALIEGTPDWGALLRACPLRGSDGGILELRPSPAFGALAPVPGSRATEPSTDQSNTLLLVGKLLIKLYRWLEAGIHPEIEVLSALAEVDAPVPGYAGALWHLGREGETAVALLQEFVEGAESGWEGPIERAAAWLRAPGSTAEVEAEHRELGRCAATLRDALAAALGRIRAPEGISARWHDDALSVLASASALDEAASDPAIAEGLSRLRDTRVQELSRVHGDLHVAQILRAPDALRVIDFEGDPTVALEARRRHDTPLRDLACLLRSVDHVGQAAARRAAGVNAAVKEGWIRAASAGVLDGWGEPVCAELLYALELAKACQELVYANRVVPEWAYAPRAGLRRLLESRAP